MSKLSRSSARCSSEPPSRPSAQASNVGLSRVNWNLNDDYHLILTILQNRRQLVLTTPAKGFWELISHKFSAVVQCGSRNPRQCRDRFHILFHKSKVLFQVETDNAKELKKAYHNKNKFNPHTDEAKAKLELDLNLLLLQVHKVLHFNKGLKLLEKPVNVAPSKASEKQKKSSPMGKIDKKSKSSKGKSSKKRQKGFSLQQVVKHFAPLGLILGKFHDENYTRDECKELKEMISEAFEKIASTLKTLCQGIQQLHDKAQMLRLLIETFCSHQKQWSGMIESLQSYCKGGDRSHFADLVRWSNQLQSHIASGNPRSLHVESKYSKIPLRSPLSRNTILSSDLVLYHDY